MRGACARGFSIVDLIVSMAIVLVLIGLLLPSLRMMRETANRVVCASNVRQIGFGLALYAEDHDDALPPSVFLGYGPSAQERALSKMILLRHTLSKDSLKSGGWDGLGYLYCFDYLRAPLVYYCPSHAGNHPFEKYADAWASDRGAIAGNYQYRGEGPNGARSLSQIRPATAALVTDMLTSVEDYSHQVGANVLRADVSVFWYDDSDGTVASALAGPGGGANVALEEVWSILDEPDNYTPIDQD